MYVEILILILHEVTGVCTNIYVHVYMDTWCVYMFV
jgi:hypothetical protein